jgi:hypothetical protein
MDPVTINQLEFLLREGVAGGHITLDQKQKILGVINLVNSKGSCMNPMYHYIFLTLDPMKTTSPKDIELAKFALSPTPWPLLQRR